MPQGKCTQKVKPNLDYFHLQNATDVIPFQSAALVLKIGTELKAYIDANGAAVWELLIHDTRPISQNLSYNDREFVVHLGDVAVYDSGTQRISTMPYNIFTTNYTVTS